MYESIDAILEDWGAGKQLTHALDKDQSYTPNQIINTAYNAIREQNPFVEERENDIKRYCAQNLPSWLEQHAAQQPDGTYKITSAPQRRQ